MENDYDESSATIQKEKDVELTLEQKQFNHNH
jgi:hypothetical protein